MKKTSIVLTILVVAMATPQLVAAAETKGHPDSSGWKDLFAPDLSDAVYPAGIWTFTDGILTATKDECIWTKTQYKNCVIDLEFKNDPDANSGVFVYCTNFEKFALNSVEIQIADDFAKKRAKFPSSSRCAAFMGHKGPTMQALHKAGEWNRMTVTCRGPIISVVLNGQAVNEIDLRQYTSAKKNPDGSDVPPWLPRAWSELPTCGHIGLQGKHHGAAACFRNLKIKAE